MRTAAVEFEEIRLWAAPARMQSRDSAPSHNKELELPEKARIDAEHARLPLAPRALHKADLKSTIKCLRPQLSVSNATKQFDLASVLFSGARGDDATTASPSLDAVAHSPAIDPLLAHRHAPDRAQSQAAPSRFRTEQWSSDGPAAPTTKPYRHPQGNQQYQYGHAPDGAYQYAPHTSYAQQWGQWNASAQPAYASSYANGRPVDQQYYDAPRAQAAGHNEPGRGAAYRPANFDNQHHYDSTNHRWHPRASERGDDRRR